MKSKNIVYTALMAALICIIAPLSIPLAGGVPISLATLAVMLSGSLLGKKWGTLSVGIYLILGCIGIPVFAGYSSGFSNVFGPTGGYLLGYLVLAFMTGWLYHAYGKKLEKGKKLIVLVLSILLGEVLLYALGTLWFMFVSKMGLMASLVYCVIPFIPGDIFKIIVTCILTVSLEKAIRIND